MRWLLFPLLTLGLFLNWTRCDAAPQVVFQQGTILALPDQKMPPIKEALDILEQENCGVQRSRRKIAVNGSCGFLRGLYRYAFLDKVKNNERTVFVEFTVFRSGGGHAFISAAPLELATN